MKAEYTRSFTRDLHETMVWVARHAPSRADVFLLKIEAICEDSISSNPAIGSWRPWLGDDIRAFHAASINRTIYYRVDETSGTLYFLRLIYRQNVKPEDFKP